MKKDSNFILTIVLTTGIIFIVGFQLFENLGKENIKLWDEARPAVNALEMSYSGNYIVPTFEDSPDHHNSKPPLNIWVKVLSMKVFGFNEFGVRFPSAVAGMFLILLIIFFSWQYMSNIYIGLLSAIVLTGSSGFLERHFFRTGEADGLLTLFIFCYALIWFIILEKEQFKSIKHYLLLALFIIFATYTKGVAGLVPITGLIIYTLINPHKINRATLNWRFGVAITISILVILSYYLIRESHDGGYIDAVLRTELGLFSESSLSIIKHPDKLYYVNWIIEKGFNWFIWLLPLGLVPFFIPTGKKYRRFLSFSWIMVITSVIILSMSVTKNQWYIAQVFPFLAMIVSMGVFTISEWVLSFIKSRVYKYIVATIIGIPLLFLCFKGNQSTYNLVKEDYSNYRLEQIGKFIRDYEYPYEELVDANILTSNVNHQYMFYMERINFRFDKPILSQTGKPKEKGMTGKHIILKKENKDFFDTHYNYKILDENKYVMFIELTSEKLVSEESTPE